MTSNTFVYISRRYMCLVLGVVAGHWLTSVHSAAGEPPRQRVRLLTIGNSFSQNATRWLPELAKADGRQLTHRAIVVGGASLQLHADKAQAFDQDPAAAAGKYRDGESLQQALASDEWDYVTIQQASIKSHDLSTYQPYAAALQRVIGRCAPSAELLVHQTWAYRVDDPRFDPQLDATSEPRTQEAMYRQLAAAYGAICSELRLRRIPVGDAFYLVDTDRQLGYRTPADFVPATAQYPALPDQTHSLHVGWRWQKVQGTETPVLRMDGHHANLAGEYLGACVWYECLFHASCLGNAFVPEGLEPQFATFLQRMAHRAVSEAEPQQAEASGQDESAPLVYNDPQPQAYRLQVRASQLDSRTREYPEINFVFGTADKPQDLQQAAVDTRVPPQGKLVIWLMGHNQQLFDRLNSYGLHAIQVSYANKWFGTLCRPQPSHSRARGDIRLEAATGEDISPELSLQRPDGLMERSLQMVKWLAQQNPQGGWDYFLRDDGRELRWDRVILSGSSHGSTTAARLAMYQRVDRVVMLCGPRDQDQDWQAAWSATPAQRFFGFSHVLDGGWTGEHYCRSWELLELNRFGPLVTVDEAQPPYGNSRRLISAADVEQDASRAHSAVTPGKASPRNAQGEFLYEPVWRYMYLHPVEAVGEAVPRDPQCDLQTAG